MTSVSVVRALHHMGSFMIKRFTASAMAGFAAARIEIGRSLLSFALKRQPRRICEKCANGKRWDNGRSG